ncbi:MAG: hypothetical protein MJE77_22665 [Proteobacteria bacterium]|nr:hypothetical protein [Pseudomonadota bacterium]
MRVTAFLALLLLWLGPVQTGFAGPQSSPRQSANQAQTVPGAAPSAQPSSSQTSSRPVAVDTRPRRPSGFWTSGQPARGGAYRYRLLGIGFVILLITLVVMVQIVRRYRQPAMAEQAANGSSVDR